MGDADGDPVSLYEEIEVGDTARTGGRTLTEADVANFAGVSGDFNHLHTDAEAMADSPVGERIAHGTLVFAAATGLLWQSRTPAEREALVAFYGVDELRFRAPTFIGDTVHVETEVTGKREREDLPGRGVVSYDCEVVNQDGTVVLSCELRSLVR